MCEAVSWGMAVDLLVFKRGKMVKTRHSGDLDESLDDEFMSLRPRGTRGKSLFSAQMNVSTKKHHSYIVGMSKQHLWSGHRQGNADEDCG